MTTAQTELQTQIGEHLAAVRARVEAAARRAGRDPSAVRIVAVTKGFGPDEVRAAYAAGLRHFGENRVQEAEAKYADLKAELPGADLRVIGHLQSNKAKRAAELSDTIETVDSLRLAERLGRLAAEQGKRLDVLIQVNVSGADTQEGVPPPEVEALARAVAAIDGLRLVGLMGIATNGGDEATVRRDFRTLRELRDRLQHDVPTLTELSMGMSGDFELAVEEGATSIRLGRVLFGNRPATYRAPEE